MWDYTASGGQHALNQDNIPAAVAHMRSYNYNAPWATTSVFEGIQDYEYLRLLREKAEGHALLQTLPNEVLAGDVDCDDARNMILDALLSP